MRVLIILLIVLIFYFYQSKIYSNNCFKKVSAEVKFSLKGIFEGETAQLVEVLINKKILPLWWITTQFQVSRNLIFSEEMSNNLGNDNYRREFFSIMPFEKITKTFNIIGGKRGFYKIEEIDLHSGDLFGINKIIANYGSSASIYVYPKLITPQELKVNFKSLTGGILTKRNLVEDPFQIRGIREYQPFDNMKTINWSATAKTGEFKVNQYDFTASQEVIIFLNVEKYNTWDLDKLVEIGISLSASIITQYLKLGMKVGLRTNGSDIITGQQISLPSVSGINQNLHFFESLARLDTTKVSVNLAALIQEEQNTQNKSPMWVVISHYYGLELKEQVALSRKQGFDVKWILPMEVNTMVDMELNKDTFLWEVQRI